MSSPPDPPRPIRVVIVDDEPLARDCVRLALRKHPGFEVVAECCDGRSAVTAIESQAPDLVFLDVQMPGVDGFEVIRRIGPERMPAVVFVTAHDAYALRAFAHHALDYLLKPFDDVRFAEAVAHAGRQLRLARESDLARRLLGLLQDYTAPATPSAVAGTTSAARPSRILVRQKGRIELVPAVDVDWLEASGNYVRVHWGDRSGAVRGTLSALLDQLGPATFVRIHRSTAVNLARVRELEPWFGGDYMAILIGGKRLRVSRRFREGILRPVR